MTCKSCSASSTDWSSALARPGLYPGRSDQRQDDQLHGVHQQMTLAAVDLLGRVHAAGPSCSPVLPLWLSRMAAVPSAPSFPGGARARAAPYGFAATGRPEPIG